MTVAALAVGCGSSASSDTPPPAAAGCSGDVSAGLAVTVATRFGQIDCDDALELWEDYLRLGPTIGEGSAAVASLGGWTCASASGGQVAATGRLGGCDRDDGGAEFVVRRVR